MLFRKNIFFLLISTLQLTLILSAKEKCYSIKNCLTCEELDYCDECNEGFKLNPEKTKCVPDKALKPKPTPKKETPPPSPLPPKKVENQPQPQPQAQPQVQPQPQPQPQQNQPQPQPQDIPNNPFKNIPISSFQRLKERDMNNAIINKILIFILVVLILSIIASVIQSLIKKFWNKGYTEEEGQEENAKVVYIR